MNVAIIGAGAAGLMAASFIKDEYEIHIFDHNEKIGKKLFITGKGRCNITNSCEIQDLIENINTNKYFCYSPFYDFTNEQVINFFNSNDLKTKVERGNRVFPLSDKSSDVIKVFEKILKDKNVNLHLNEKVNKIYKSNKFYLTTSSDEYEFDKLIIACGGKSYPNTGSDGSLYNQITKLGHTIHEMKPGLSAIILKENVEELEGVSLKNVGLKCYLNKKLIFNEIGEMIFTRKGISGPLVLTLSSILCNKNGDIKISVDLKPGLTDQKLDDRILRDFSENQNKTIENAISKITIKKLILPILKSANINPNKKVNEITKSERDNLRRTLKSFDFTYVSNEKLDYAIISVGGVDVNEIDPSTMESKLVKDLYFCGEIIDVTICFFNRLFSGDKYMKKIKYENESKLYYDINDYIKDKNFDILLISTPKVMKEIFDDKLIKTNKNILISSRMLRKNDDDNVYIELINNDVYSVTVDGPSGSGKSTVCKLISDILNIEYLDTGSMYRSLAYFCLKENVNLENEQEVMQVLNSLDITFESSKIKVNGEFLNDKIRTNDVSMAASKVSTYYSVREKLVEIQRQIASDKAIILDGRDAGTNILKNADYKFYLDASPEVRAKRRFDEQKDDSSYETILKDIKLRDEQDKNRKHAPLRQAEDAVLINSDDMNVDEVVEKIIEIIRGRNVL